MDVASIFNMPPSPALKRFESIAAALVWLTPLLWLAGPAPADIAVSIVAALFLAHSIITRDFGWWHQRWLQVLFVLWLYMVIRTCLIADWQGQMLRSAGWVRYLMFAAALGSWLLRNESTRYRLMLSIIASTAFLAGDGLLQYFHGTDLLGKPRIDFETLVRLTGPYSKPRLGVTLVWQMFPAIAGLLLWKRFTPSHANLLAGLLCILCLVTVYLSGERMALLLMLMGFGLLGLLLPSMRRMAMTGAVVAVLLAVILSQANPLLFQRQIQTTETEIGRYWESTYGRTLISSWNITRAHPWFGIGAKQFQIECVKPDYGAVDAQSLHYRCPMHPHNRYAEWLVEHGFTGLILFLLAMGLLGWQLRLPWRVWQQQPLASVLAITLVVRLWPISAGTSQFVPWAAVPFWLVNGWLLAEVSAIRAQALDAPARLH
jgi:O-antigen ligase